jgi:predicted RNA binding protein YcfA (HicA-like mRNA interferase family)
MPLTYKQLRKIIDSFDYILVAQKWSHQKFRHKLWTIEIPKHKELAVGTARNICKDIAKQQWTTLETITELYEIKW